MPTCFPLANPACSPSGCIYPSPFPLSIYLARLPPPFLAPSFPVLSPLVLTNPALAPSPLLLLPSPSVLPVPPARPPLSPLGSRVRGDGHDVQRRVRTPGRKPSRHLPHTADRTQAHEQALTQALTQAHQMLHKPRDGFDGCRFHAAALHPRRHMS